MLFRSENLSQVLEKSDLGLDDGLEGTTEITSCKFVGHGDLYYVLVIKAEKQLRNGFRYIKELLLQSHNFKLMQAYDALAEANVKVTSVKTDCFTIPAKDEAKARELLTFDQGIGTWRVSKTQGIVFPFENLALSQLDDVEIKHLETNQLTVNDEWDEIGRAHV